MKLYIFGTCSGTEPFLDRHHTSWALEYNGRVYWFDAGEGCAHTAYLMGVDLLAVSDIFITHPHMDHIGGLPHLLWTIRKLYTRTDTLPKYGDISVYASNSESFDGVMAMLKNSEGGYKAPYKTVFNKIADKKMFSGDITVTAKHNLHIAPTNEGYQSYSFIIDAAGKRIVYTGDIASLDELDALVCDGCNLLLIETGHHDATKICERVKSKGIEHVYFLHHNRKIIQNYDEMLIKCKEIMPDVTFCNDKDVFEYNQEV